MRTLPQLPGWQDFLGDGFRCPSRLLHRPAGGDADVEVLALRGRRMARITEAVERRANRLALRIEDRGFQRDEYARVMGKPNIGTGPGPRSTAVR